jgi:hypothetical protein
MDAVPVRAIVAPSASLPEAGGVDFDVASTTRPGRDGRRGRHPARTHSLIGNALKCAATAAGSASPRARPGDDGFVLVSVADRPRHRADDLAHIFEPFYRGRAAVEQQIRGNGIGLSLVQQLLQALGGRVSVSPRRDRAQGSRSTFRSPPWPLSRPAPIWALNPPDDPIDRAGQGAAGGGQPGLVLTSPIGCAARLHRDIGDGRHRRLTQATSDAFDVILLDVLPNMNGSISASCDGAGDDAGHHAARGRVWTKSRA